MAYLLDSDICVQLLRRKSSHAAHRLGEAPPNAVYLCTPVLYELTYGAYHSDEPERHLATLEAFWRTMICLPFDQDAAVKAGQIRAALAAVGTPIGPVDLLIAGIALTHDFTLVTHNTREFSRVANLRLEDWEVPPPRLNGAR